MHEAFKPGFRDGGSERFDGGRPHCGSATLGAAPRKRSATRSKGKPSPDPTWHQG